MTKANKKLVGILEQERERVEAILRVVGKKSVAKNPILYMQLLMASNCLRVAAYAAGRSVSEKLDKNALTQQFFNYLNEEETIEGGVKK